MLAIRGPPHVQAKHSPAHTSTRAQFEVLLLRSNTSHYILWALQAHKILILGPQGLVVTGALRAPIRPYWAFL